MTADAAEGTGGRRMRRRWKVLIALLCVFVVALAVLWTQRRPIARGFVDRELARRGVPARYTIADIGLSTQRLTNVVIGDPASPDLVADWVEVRTEVGLSGAALTGLVAGHVRMRARLRGGTLSFGVIDRMLPPPSGKPFALPAINARVDDLRLRIEAPQGIVGARLSGAGKLDDGFAGRLALVSDRLTASSCAFDRVRAVFAVRVASARPSIEGPARVAEARCGTTRVSGIAADLAVTLGAALDRWTGRMRAAATGVVAPQMRSGDVIAQATFDGTRTSTAGNIALTAIQPVLAQGSAENAQLKGRYRVGTAVTEFAGRVRADHARAADAWIAAIGGLDGAGGGTPVGPLLAALSKAGVAAARDLSADGAIEAVVRGDARAIRVTSLALTSASGARADLGGRSLRFGAVEIGGRVTIAGGGLPDALIDLVQSANGLSGHAVVKPYAVGGARLALTPVDFRAGRGALTQVTTAATLSGPLGDGRVDDLRLPVEARWRGRTMLVDPACVPVAWRRVAVSGLVLDPARLALCPTGAGLVTLDNGQVGGGARIGASRLTGRLGGAPLALATTGADLRLGDNGFTVAGLQTRLGTRGRLTRIDAQRLTGRIVGSRVAGEFAGGSGQIANVPLLLSDAGGTWSLAGGKLALGGRLTVADAAAERRFEPLASENVTLSLVGNRIAAAGTLTHPAKGIRVADVTIAHDLSQGRGNAVIVVPRIPFGDRFQPNDLTPITYGVIADVHGDISGKGRIEWTPDGVVSTGTFGTPGLDFAAAFGPVTGLKGDVVFTDLLGLVSAPDQVATIATVNPGVAVENGTVRYQLVGDSRVRIAGASWPFANGKLLLDPTMLDFNANQERRMTFRIDGADAAAFLQQFDFDNLSATGTFDGMLPMVFDDGGGRIVDGRLAARGSGGIAYVGTITEKDVGVWGNMAFQALKALDYRNLGITLNGPLAGEMVTEIRFAGVSQGAGTKSNFLIRRLAKLPFVFNITVTAPFRQLLDSVRSYYDPSRLIERNLPALLEERKRRKQGVPPAAPSIQPPESEKKP